MDCRLVPLDHRRHPKQLLTAPEDTLARSRTHLLFRRHTKFTEEPPHLYPLSFVIVGVSLHLVSYFFLGSSCGRVLFSVSCVGTE